VTDPTKSETEPTLVVRAKGLRTCLATLAQEAAGFGFHHCALHLRVAMLELDDEIALAEANPPSARAKKG
jgi:hypothetical protein